MSVAPARRRSAIRIAGRLINAQEEERSRIARDLHDDLSQQLAGVSMMLSDIDSEPGTGAALQTLQDRVSALARNVRSLSHELHPGVLEHAGLVMTLRRHCAEPAHHHRLEITFSAEDNLDALRADAALCLFRVAQEAALWTTAYGQNRSQATYRSIVSFALLGEKGPLGKLRSVMQPAQRRGWARSVPS